MRPPLGVSPLLLKDQFVDRRVHVVVVPGLAAVLLLGFVQDLSDLQGHFELQVGHGLLLLIARNQSADTACHAEITSFRRYISNTSISWSSK